MRGFLCVIALLGAETRTFAQAPAPVTASPPGTPAPVWPYGTSAIGLMLGTDTSFEGGPASFRLTIQNGHDVVGNDKFAFGATFPLTIVTQGEGDNVGVSASHTALEFPPSLRFRVWPMSVVRLYADLGIGFVWLTSSAGEGWYDTSTTDFGFMTRFAIGLEMGPPRGFQFLLEPISTRTYWLGDTYGRFGIMAGAGLRF